MVDMVDMVGMVDMMLDMVGMVGMVGMVDMVGIFLRTRKADMVEMRIKKKRSARRRVISSIYFGEKTIIF